MNLHLPLLLGGGHIQVILLMEKIRRSPAGMYKTLYIMGSAGATISSLQEYFKVVKMKFPMIYNGFLRKLLCFLLDKSKL